MYVTGDFHGYADIGKLNAKRFPMNKLLSKEDYVIVAGDFGLVWDNKRDELYWRKWLEGKNFTTLFVDGNHENFNLLHSYPIEIWNGGKIHRISKSIIHLMRGQVFIINGWKIFTFGGAQSHDKDYRKENVNWWPQEKPSIEEYREGMENLDKHNWNVDFVITHMCPTSIINPIKELIQTEVERDEISDYLDEISQRLCYKKWFFGHLHGDIPLSDKHRLIYQDVEKLD